MAENEFPTFEEAVRSGRVDGPDQEPTHKGAIVVWTTPDTSIRTRVNLNVFAGILAQHGWQVAVFAEWDGDEVRRAHLLAEPAVSAQLVRAIRAHVDAREHLSEDAYWEAMDPVIQGVWDTAPTGDRITLVLEGEDPMEAVLDAAVPDGAARAILLGLED